MSSAPRRAEFFALEANEYLADLEPLTAAHDRPDAERLVRGARALRGAALMAGLGTFARAAAGLEAVARQVRDHALAWEPNAREAWIDGLSSLRTLVARASQWEATDDRQALALAERFEQVMSGKPARATLPAPAALTPGVRAFIARESALIAGSLEQASRALAPIPPAEALNGVLERMQSLRGLGASAELSPLPELLDAMEVATRALLADVAPPPNVAAVFADAAHALSTIARAIADAGQIVPPPELESIARRLLDAYATENDVVPILTLAPDGAESMLREGTPPSVSSDTDPVPVELVSVGDHLVAAADALARPTSPAARDLRLFVLHRTLAAMPSRSATGNFIAPLAEAISQAIGKHVATDRPDAFVAMVRGCGRFLVEAGSVTDRVALIRRRDAIATSLVMVGLGAPAGGFETRAAIAPEAAVVRDIPAPAPVEPPVQISPPQMMPEIENLLMPSPPARQLLPEIEDLLVVQLPPEPELEKPAELPIVPATIDAYRRPPTGMPVVDHDEPLPVPEPLIDQSFGAPQSVDDDIVEIASLAPDEVADDIISIDALAPDVEATDDDTSDVIAIADLAPDDEPEIVSIESLAPDAPTAPAIPEHAPGTATRLERAYTARALRLAKSDSTEPSVSGLIGEQIVPVALLLYRGESALNRAVEIRNEIQTVLAEPSSTMEQLRPFLHELLDLIPLAREAA